MKFHQILKEFGIWMIAMPAGYLIANSYTAKELILHIIIFVGGILMLFAYICKEERVFTQENTKKRP